MSPQQQDHYAILGVAPDASPAQITHAYRGLLRRHHPDTRARANQLISEDHDQALQRILAAYAVLHDAQQRLAYDRQRQAHPARPRASSRHDQSISVRITRPRNNPTPPVQAGPVRWHYRETPPSQRAPFRDRSW
jgi:DnaJ-class molecular chaperone